MPGNPIEMKMWSDISKMGGPDAILRRTEEGATMTTLAAELGVSRSFLSWNINAIPGMKQKLIDARRARADVYAEQALTIADAVPEDPNAINKAKVKIEVRKWLAGVDNPEQYGQKPAQVNISIGGLHLDALRRVQADAAKTISAPDVIDAEATDVSGE